MSKLKDLEKLVNLCKLIPQGEFEDSAFFWIDKGHTCILPTDRIYPEAAPFIELRRYTIQGDGIPAPMFVEIIDELPAWELQEDLLYAFDRNERALKIWLKWKGIEYEN